MGKKLLCIFLGTLIAAGSCSVFAADTDEGDLKFAVASDLHYCVPREQLEGDIDDPVYWYANRRAAMEDESGFIIDEFLRQCAQSDCEYVLISGDLADNGRRDIQQHYDVAAKLARFEAETGKDVFVIDGNHDFGANDEVKMDTFKTIYADFGYDKALTTVEDDCSYTADLGEKYRLIALDSCDPTVSTEDGMSLKKLSWVKGQCKQAKADGKYVILMMHHNLLDHMPAQRILSRNFIIRNHLSTASLFADLGIKIVLTGHEHCSDVATYTSAAGNVIYDFATTSLTMYPLEYREFSLMQDEIVYASKTVDKIDTAALADTTDGYSADQLALMDEGLNAYAKGFLKAGVRYRLELSLSMEKLGISESAPYYRLVNTAVSKLTGLLKMPLYGENSVESKAESYGITLPRTDYKNGWDLATEFIAAHYAGSEKYTLQSAELRALLLTVSVLLRYELDFSDPVLLSSGADALLKNYGLSAQAQSLNALADTAFEGSVTPAEYFIVALISPLISDFISDSDGVDDNNGSLPGYGSVDCSARAENISSNIKSKLSKMFSCFAMVISGILKAILSVVA